MLTSIDTWTPQYAWATAASTLQPVPGVDESSDLRVVLAGGGRFVMYSRHTLDIPDESIPYGHRLRCHGPYRLTLADGRVDEANFTPRPDWRVRLGLAGSPDGQRVVIAEHWGIARPIGQPSDPQDARCTLWLADFSDVSPCELLTFTGEQAGGADDLALQWSGNGATIALAAYFHATSETGPATVRVLLYDSISGEQTGVLEDHTLVGSLAFSPDGTRLLVADRDSVVGIHHLNTGRTDPIPLIPMSRPDTTNRSVPRLLGFADNTRLLIADQRGRTMTISTTDPAGTDIQPRLRWTGGLDMYPVLAAMPEGFWD